MNSNFEFDISSCLTENYDTALRMWAIEYLRVEPLRRKPMSTEEAFMATFDKYDFSKHKGDSFNQKINSIRTVPWLHKYLKFVFDNEIDINDQLDCKVKILRTRKDGLQLGYILDLHVSSIPDVEDEGTIDPYYFEYRYSNEDDETFQPLVIIDQQQLLDNNILFNYNKLTETYDLSCYRSSDKDKSNDISYHYWNE